MASAASLSEPSVLAHAKRRLFPDPDEPDTYAVVDTQFAVEELLAVDRFDDQPPPVAIKAKGHTVDRTQPVG